MAVQIKTLHREIWIIQVYCLTRIAIKLHFIDVCFHLTGQVPYIFKKERKKSLVVRVPSDLVANRPQTRSNT